MQVFSTPDHLREFLFQHRKLQKTIGLVPTMGALHQGHVELVKSAVNDTDITVCSIYVNPTQFNNKSDLERYPRDLERDLQMLKSQGCHAVFCPSDEDMYPDKPMTTLDFGNLERVMEGFHRPGHFSGVALVVSKLFHMVQPDLAFFGAKDWQQLVIIKQMVRDLNFPLKIVTVPIVREGDGLAMSSRNQRLSMEHRAVAPELYRALQLVQNRLNEGASTDQAITSGLQHLDQFPLIELEYLEISRSDTLEKPDKEPGSEPLSVCIAAFLGEVRLIDNVSIFSS